jgi:hypothetical protein
MPPQILFTALRKSDHLPQDVRSRALVGLQTSTSAGIVFQEMSEEALDTIFLSSVRMSGTDGFYRYDPTILFSVNPEQETLLLTGQYRNYTPAGYQFRYDVVRHVGYTHVLMGQLYSRYDTLPHTAWYPLAYPEVVYPVAPMRDYHPGFWQMFRASRPDAVRALVMSREASTEGRAVEYVLLAGKRVDEIISEAQAAAQAHELKAQQDAQSRGGLRRVLFIGEDP